MKKLIKYSVTILLLLLIGYGQLFAHVNHGHAIYSSLKSVKESTHDKPLIFKAVETDEIYIEEVEKEDDRFSFKKNSTDDSYNLYFDHLQEFFFQQKKNCQAYGKQLSEHSSVQYPYLVFCVFRI